MTEHEKIFPAPDILNDLPCGKFVLANLAAKRAKQIKDGAPPLVRIDSNHPLSIAYAEIAAGKIKPILGSDVQQSELDEDYSTYEELAISDVGLLLPVHEDDEMDDLDLDLDDLDLGDDEDDDDEKENVSDEVSLSDLLGDDEEETPAAASDDEDDAVASSDDESDMSLDDLAAQEEAGDDSEED